MKKNFLFTATLLLLVSMVSAQSNNFLVKGGWATASPNDSDESLSGYKIAGQYEYVVGYNKWAFGVSISYLDFESTDEFLQTKFFSWPLNFHGKYRFGENKIQGYVKGVAGFQFFTAKFTGPNTGEAKATDLGLTIGAGAGADYNVSEKVFINLDYELLYLTNAFYNNGLTNAVTIGVGYRFN